MYWSVTHNIIFYQCFNSVEACYFGPFFYLQNKLTDEVMDQYNFTKVSEDKCTV